MDGYYDPHSRVVLPKPKAFIGFWGARVPEVVVAVSQMSGIPFFDVERGIEHAAGTSVRDYIEKHGSERLMKLEQTVIKNYLRGMSMPPVIALRPSSFQYSATRQYVLHHCETLYLKKNVFLLFSQMLNILDRKELSRDFSIPVSNVRDINQVAQCMREYEEHYSLAHRTISVERDHPLETARQLINALI